MICFREGAGIRSGYSNPVGLLFDKIRLQPDLDAGHSNPIYYRKSISTHLQFAEVDYWQQFVWRTRRIEGHKRKVD